MASPPPTKQPPANKFTNDCIRKFMVNCLFVQLSLFGLFWIISISYCPRTQNVAVHKKLVYVATILELCFVAASLALATLYFFLQFNMWEFFPTKIFQTSVVSIGFAALMMAVFSAGVPDQLMVMFITVLCIISFSIIVIPLIDGVVTANPSSEVCVPSHVIDIAIVESYLEDINKVESVDLETKPSFSKGHLVLKAETEDNLSALDAEDFHDLAGMFYATLRRLSSAVTLDKTNLVNMLSTGHTVIIEARSCRRFFTDGEMNVEYGDEQELVEGFVMDMEHQLKTKCNESLSLIDQHLIPSTECAESLVFLYKMKGDYFRYLAELREGLNSDAFCSIEAYEKAIKFAASALSPSNPIRLSLALNCAVLHYEILNCRQRAYEIARLAYDEAVTSEISYSDSNVIMELIKGKLTRWSAHVVEEGENMTKEPEGGE